MCLFHPSHPRGGHPPHSNLVRGKLTSPTPTLQETVLRPIREDDGEDISDTLGCTSCAMFLPLAHFNVVYDLFQKSSF